MGENAVKRRTAKLLMEMFLNTLRLSIFYDIIRQTISFSLQELVADEISVFMCHNKPVLSDIQKLAIRIWPFYRFVFIIGVIYYYYY